MHRCSLLLTVALGFWSTAGQAMAADRPPNIVFILADDLGVYDLACYGRREHQTPRLDRLAAEGLRFTSAYCAQPICSPSRAAILTGKYPARLHLTTYLPGRADAPSQKLLQPTIRQELPLEEVTLAERLREAGYATACIGKWHLGGQGFDPAAQGFDFVHAGQANTVPSAEEGGKGEYDLTRAAERFIDAHREQPFFLHLCHNTPHIPLAARPELEARFSKSFNPTYAAMLATLDDCVGRVLDRLDAAGLAENTIVVFTSDNGGLHVFEFPGSPATHNGPFRAGKGFVYEGGLRVPAIVRWPGKLAAGRTIDAPTIDVDFVPTLLEWCGVQTGDAFDGQSQAGVWQGAEPASRTFFWHFPHYTNQGSRPAGALRENRWKLVEHYEDGRLELFDLDQDPGETRNLAAAQPDRAEKLRAKLAAWRQAMQAQTNAPNPRFDAELHRRLYLDVDVSLLKPRANAENTAEPLRAWRALMNRVVAKK